MQWLYVLVFCVLLMQGCTDAVYGIQRRLIGADCRPEVAQANGGWCKPLAQGH